MAIRLRELLFEHLSELRFEPIDKRIRARLGSETVIDSRRALLVWEPKRVVPSYAVPEKDVAAVVLAGGGADIEPDAPPRLGERPVYDPSVPFSVHTTPGQPLTVRGRGGRTANGFRPADPALAGYVVLDFDGFDAWFEEDEPNVAHPRDPFHRIDVVRSSRHVRVELDGESLAESRTPILLFEPPLPVRYYLAPADVRLDLLEPSATRTACAYKGQASYLAHRGEDVAWRYEQPLREAALVTGRVAFFNERVDLVVDGERLERPWTPWSRPAKTAVDPVGSAADVYLGRRFRLSSTCTPFSTISTFPGSTMSSGCCSADRTPAPASTSCLPMRQRDAAGRFWCAATPASARARSCASRRSVPATSWCCGPAGSRPSPRSRSRGWPTCSGRCSAGSTGSRAPRPTRSPGRWRCARRFPPPGSRSRPPR